jgi:drug/metabolite transporter (DMT)-like permease
MGRARCRRDGVEGGRVILGDARDRIALPAVFVGVLAVGAAAIFIRLADAPALGIAFWRCALGVVALVPLAAFNREGVPGGRELLIGAASGVALGAHFGTWILSLEYTSVAASVVLVSTTPVFVAAAAYPLFGERTSAISFAGILLAIAGTAFIAAGEHSPGGAASFGNALALVGAVTMGVYVLIGRSLRTGGLGALSYSIVGYSAAALALLLVAIPSGVQLWGYSATTWFWLFVITLGPQLLGHTVLNWALEFVRASLVSGAILAEPVIAALLAWVVLSERPGLATVLGGLVVLAGLYLLVRGEGSPAQPPPTHPTS